MPQSKTSLQPSSTSPRRRRSPSDPADSSPASAPASTSDDVAGDAGAFVTDPGPAFDAGAEPEPAPAPVAELDALLGWEEEQVRQLLEAQGVVLHQVAAVAKGESAEWLYTQAELRAIAGPLTRILNSYDVTRAAAGTADPLVLMIGVSGYVTRSYSERRRLLAALAGPPAPLTGLQPDPPEPTPGPDTEASWTTS